ncbi:hypothetical protein ASE04_11165 [Rhizobium sp. Root708]|nr:hypothetical protein ASE04_11165 [Rhizobium sp. Root708]
MFIQSTALWAARKTYVPDESAEIILKCFRAYPLVWGVHFQRSIQPATTRHRSACRGKIANLIAIGEGAKSAGPRE